MLSSFVVVVAIVLLAATRAPAHAQVPIPSIFGGGGSPLGWINAEPRAMTASASFVFVVLYGPGLDNRLVIVSRTGGIVLFGPTTIDNTDSEGAQSITTARDGSVICVAFSTAVLKCFLVDSEGLAIETSSRTITEAVGMHTSRNIVCAGDNGEFIYVTTTNPDVIVRYTIDAFGVLGLAPTEMDFASIGPSCTDALGAFVAKETVVTALVATPDRTRIVAIWNDPLPAATWIVSVLVNPLNGGVTSCVQHNNELEDPVPGIPTDLRFATASNDYVFISGVTDQLWAAPFVARWAVSTLASWDAQEAPNANHIMAVSPDFLHLYMAPLSGDMLEYEHPLIADGVHTPGYAELNPFTMPRGLVVSPLGDKVYLLARDGSTAVLFTVTRDLATFTPTLVEPMSDSNPVWVGALNLIVLVHEATPDDTIQVHFQYTGEDPDIEDCEITAHILDYGAEYPIIIDQLKADQELSGYVPTDGGCDLYDGTYNIWFTAQDIYLHDPAPSNVAENVEFDFTSESPEVVQVPATPVLSHLGVAVYTDESDATRYRLRITLAEPPGLTTFKARHVATGTDVGVTITGAEFGTPFEFILRPSDPGALEGVSSTDVFEDGTYTNVELEVFDDHLNPSVIIELDPFVIDTTGGDGGDDDDDGPAVDCVVSDWSEWSTCPVTCGTTGVQTRTRTVTAGSIGCPGLISVRACTPTPPACPGSSNCAWTEWTTSSICFVNATRDGCQNIVVRAHVPEYFAEGTGEPCTGDAATVGTCTSCVQDCSMTEWSEWSACADDARTRTREVANIKLGTGLKCGALTESGPCEGATVDAAIPSNVAIGVISGLGALVALLGAAMWMAKAKAATAAAAAGAASAGESDTVALL